ncbi:MAG TPA: nucleotidyltransferase family protein [Gemmatimonadales bacterium]|jgi:hypothetical protein
MAPRHHLNPVQVRRLLARTLRVALDGSPATTQLIDRWACAEAPEASWVAAITWDGVGAAVGWALNVLELDAIAPPALEVHATDAYDEARTQSVQLTADLMRIGTELDAVGIASIALKGSALLTANYAPDLGIRWMSDLDILVKETQVEQAAWVLESLDYVRGYERDAKGPEVFRPYHETFTSPEGRQIELHWRLGPSRWGRAASAGDWFTRAEPTGMPGLMVPMAADLFWHFLLHDARNHAWSTGSLRAAMDLALVARAPDFDIGDVVRHLQEDSHPEPLLEAMADAAHLSPRIAAEIEPSAEPRYLRLASWRDSWGRRRWKTERISEAISWGATFDRVRRFGGWRGIADRALRIVPEAVKDEGVFASVWRGLLTIRHAAFIGALAAGHLITIPESHVESRKRLKPAN